VTLPRAAIFLLIGFLVSCSHPPSETRSIGEAYVGPATLLLRQELTPKAAVSGTVKHGEKLEILEYKRRFVKVRTTQGAEGWTDTRQLLTPEQMAGLRQMAESALKFTSQGAATVFEPLNMHTEPNRASPSFWQIPDTARVDVIGHKLTPRTQAQAATAPAATQQSRTPRRKSKDKPAPSKTPPPPVPAAPKPPDNWLELSVPREDGSEEIQPGAPKVEQKPAEPVPMDDWDLVRTKDGKVGWVLMRALSMAIPDEVAQYAEGHRITSYFALGHSEGGDSDKNDWLWTTITKGLEPYEFDSFRVFVWSRKHHRYETAYIERKVVGHYPVEVDNSGAVPRFSLLLEGDGGQLVRKTYTFEGYRVRMVNKEPYQPERATPAQAVAAPPQPAPKPRSWYTRMKDGVRKLFH
jgi:SH3-like domain-containing protein